MTDPDRSRPGVTRRSLLRTGAGCAAGGAVVGRAAGRTGSQRGGRTLDFLFQNAWMVPGVFGNSTDFAAPELDARARELGRRLDADGYDVAALCEVFADDQRTLIRENVDADLDGAIGPPADVENSSGLYTLTLDGPPITATDRHEFENDGAESRDASAWSNKGVLFTRLELGAGAVDLFTTHLLAGGTLPFAWLCDPDTSPAQYRALQLKELFHFVTGVKDEYDPDRERPTVVAGDMNVAASDREFVHLRTIREHLGLYDVWERHGTGRGGTNRAALLNDCAPDVDADSPYCRDGNAGERIDYVLVEESRESHAIDLRVDDVRRRVFWRERAPPDQFYVGDDEEAVNYLADHVGLEVRFRALPR